MQGERHPAFAGARSFLVFARADDVLEVPEMLAAYASTFGAGDDATLALGTERLDDGLVADLDRLLGGSLELLASAPDIQVAEHPHIDWIASLADAVLVPVAGENGQVPPRFGPVDMPALVTLYQGRLATGGAAQTPVALPPAVAPFAAEPGSVQEFQTARIAQFRGLSNCRTIGYPAEVRHPLYLRGDGVVEFGNDVSIGWPASPGFLSLYVGLDAALESSRIVVGDEVFLGNGTAVRSEGAGVEIGSRSLIGDECRIYDSDFHGIRPDQRHGGFARTGHTRIGTNAWLGSNVLVLRGADIGDDTVVGAGSVVASSLPPGVVAAGNPARVIRAIEDPPA